MSNGSNSSPYTVDYVNALEHYRSALPIWTTCFGEVDAVAFPVQGPFELKAQWSYQLSPLPSRLALLQRADELVGVAALTARSFHGVGSPVTGALLGDFAVLRAHRSLGPAMKIQQTAISEGVREFDFVYGFSTEQKKRAHRKAAFSRYERLDRYVFVLRPERFLPQTLGSAPNKLIGKLGRLLASCWLGLLRMTATTRTSLQEVHDFDASFDELWDSCKQSGLRLGERDTAYLRWRFGNSEGKYRIFKLVSKRNNALLGYAVVSQGETWNLMDLLVLRHQPGLIKSLLLHIVSEARQSGASHLGLNFLGPERVVRTFHQLLFLRHKSERLLAYTPGERLKDEVWDANQWYITLADEVG